jgi:hypothetical protein
MKLKAGNWAGLSALALSISLGMAAAAEMTVSKGTFHGGPHAPADTASGGVSLVRLDGGQYELRLADDFTTTAGPDLFVYLSAAKDPKSDKAVTDAVFHDAGKLQAISGGQRYALPAGFDPKKFKSVAVWCKSFAVLFGAASLASP